MGGSKPVFIFGAGASAAYGGPLTDEILYIALTKGIVDLAARDGDIADVRECLKEHFHVPDNASPTQFPSLTMLLSILDLAIEQNRPMPAGPGFPYGLDRKKLTEVRAAIEYIIFRVLDHSMSDDCGTAYRQVLDSSLVDPGQGVRAISLNYDIVLDLMMCQKAGGLGKGLPDYRCDIQTPKYQEAYASPGTWGTLLKLHGSLNWAFCPGCQRLEIGMTEKGKELAQSSQLAEVYDYLPLKKHYLCVENSCSGCRCRHCGAALRPVMITPSFVKDYRNPHIQRVWYEAEKVLRESTHAYIIGYSLPNDDVAVIHLLRRGLRHLGAHQVTVVLKQADAMMEQRYRTHFGDELTLHVDGFAEWAANLLPATSLSPMLSAPQSLVGGAVQLA